MYHDENDKKRIMKLLEKNPEMDSFEIAIVLNLSIFNVHYFINQLQDEGLITII
jgi:DNA-binding Lrp family transcriptional regulator